MIWIAATLIAAIAQTARNAAQAGLTRQIGTVGATAVRFVFGFPFAALALGTAATVRPLPWPDLTVLAWVMLGAVAQIAATAFMLLTMRGQGFGVATALMKTEPVTLAVIGAVVLAEPIGPARFGAIAVATLGVVLASSTVLSRAAWGSITAGVVSGALFGLSALGFRGALLALPDGNAAIRAVTVLTIALGLQALAMMLWLILRDRSALTGILGEWRISLWAGMLGAIASLFWFIGFALAPAANVRTLALIEVVLAQVLAGRLFRQKVAPFQLVGMGLIMVGVGWLLIVAT